MSITSSEETVYATEGQSLELTCNTQGLLFIMYV